MVTLEQILDKIAEVIMLNINYYSDDPKLLLKQNQKTVRNGLIIKSIGLITRRY